MGWTGMYETFSSKLDAVIASEGIKRENIVASNTSGRVVNLAYKLDDNRVIGVVCLVEVRNARTNPETLVKCMDESMGPYECSASAKVLDALTPTECEHANGWREKCRARLERDKTSKAALKQIKVGDVRKTIGDRQFGPYTVMAGTVLKVTEKRRGGVVCDFGNVRLMFRGTKICEQTTAA